jgi:hypothetical protein
VSQCSLGRLSVRTDPTRVTRSRNRPRPHRPYLHCPLALRHLRAARPCSRDRSRPPCTAQLMSHAPDRGTDLALLRAALAHTCASRCGHAPSASSSPLPRFVPPQAPHQRPPLHVGVELRVDKSPFSSKQQVDVTLESACCKRLFQVF